MLYFEPNNCTVKLKPENTTVLKRLPSSPQNPVKHNGIELCFLSDGEFHAFIVLMLLKRASTILTMLSGTVTFELLEQTLGQRDIKGSG